MNSIPHPAHDSFMDWLAARLTALAQRDDPRTRARGLTSISLALPQLRLTRVPRLRPGDFYWNLPERHIRLLGRGRAWECRSNGPHRFSDLDRQLRRQQTQWRHLDPDDQRQQPLALITSAFDGADSMQAPWHGMPNASLYVPELLLHQTGSHCRLVLSGQLDRHHPMRCIQSWLDRIEALMEDASAAGPRPLAVRPERVGLHPADTHWLSLARHAIAALDAGTLDKLVLYRHLESACPGLQPERLLAQLAAAYPSCQLIAAVHEDASFVCASPERLLEKHGRRVSSDALAGTAALSPLPGGSEQAARDLRDDSKTRREHDLVHQSLRHTLAPLCSELDPSTPAQVRPVGNLMHLYNRVSGHLRSERSPLELAARLHPTPAVNGSPTQLALRWLRDHDQAGRGWYSGFAGWIDRHGDAQLNVLLRCALLRDGRAELFAGAGLVGGSDPQAELAETDLKLDAVLDCLGAL